MRLHATLGFSRAPLVQAIASHEWEKVFIYSDSEDDFEEFVERLGGLGSIGGLASITGDLEYMETPSLDRESSDKPTLVRGLIEDLKDHKGVGREDVLFYSGSVTHLAAHVSIMGFRNILSIVEGEFHIEGPLSREFSLGKPEKIDLDLETTLKIHGLEIQDGGIVGLGVGEASLDCNYQIGFEGGKITLDWGDLGNVEISESNPDYGKKLAKRRKLEDHFCIFVRGCHRAAGHSIVNNVENKEISNWLKRAGFGAPRNLVEPVQRPIEPVRSRGIWFSGMLASIFMAVRRTFQRWKGVPETKAEGVQLIVILPPNQCITAAISVQSHCPDKVLIITPRARWMRGEMRDTPAQRMFRAWIRGAEELVAEVTRDGALSDPFPIHYTPPEGYSGDPEMDIEELWCYNDEILEKVREATSKWQGETRFDILPGAKGVKIPVVLHGMEGGVSLWETLAHGERMGYSAEMRNVKLVDGASLSIIDRCWLSGWPVHAEEHRRRHKGEGFPDEQIEFLRGIAECFTVNEPSMDDSVLGLVNEDALANLGESGYEFETYDTDGPNHHPGESIRISKDGISRKFLFRRSPDQVNFWRSQPGEWLEEFVEASLWRGWNPTSTVRNLSLIYPNADRRMDVLIGRWKGNHKEWVKWRELGANDSEHTERSWEWKELCDRHGMDPGGQFDEGDWRRSTLVKNELERLHSAGEEDRFRMLRNVRKAEIDVVLLDSMGITTFDSKARFSRMVERIMGESPNTLRMKKKNLILPLASAKGNKQSPDWLVENQFYAIHSTRSSGQSPFLPKRIHMQRMWGGRKVLEGEEDMMSVPLTLPPGYATYQERKKANDARRAREASEKKGKRQCDYCGSTEHNRPQCGKLADDRASGAEPKRKRRHRKRGRSDL